MLGLRIPRSEEERKKKKKPDKHTEARFPRSPKLASPRSPRRPDHFAYRTYPPPPPRDLSCEPLATSNPVVTGGSGSKGNPPSSGRSRTHASDDASCPSWPFAALDWRGVKGHGAEHGTMERQLHTGLDFTSTARREILASKVVQNGDCIFSKDLWRHGLFCFSGSGRGCRAGTGLDFGVMMMINVAVVAWRCRDTADGD